MAANRRFSLAAGACIVLALAGLGAAPERADQGICILGLGQCDTPTDAPTETPTDDPTSGADDGDSGSGGLGDLLPSLPALPSTPGDDPSPTLTVPNDEVTKSLPDLGVVSGHPRGVFTDHPAELRTSNLSISGLKGIGLVNVPIKGGGTVKAIEIDADEIVAYDVSLKVTVREGHGLITTSSALTNRGHAVFYVNGITADTSKGLLRLATGHIPDDLKLSDLSPLSSVVVSLIGVSADASIWQDAHEQTF